MDLAFVDVETTGLDPAVHEIIELAVVRVGWSLRSPQFWSTKVRPERIEDASPEALEINGYTPEGWADALALEDALRKATPLLEDATIAGHNPDFDWRFLSRGYASAGLRIPEVDYHRLDTASLAWLTKADPLDSVSLDDTCARLGLDRGPSHRALSDAFASLAVAKRLRRVFGGELTLGDVAAQLRISEKTAYDLARRGELPAFKVGRQWRVRHGDLARWIDSQRVRPAESA